MEKRKIGGLTNTINTKQPGSTMTNNNTADLNTRLPSFKPPRDLTLKSGFVPLQKNTVSGGLRSQVFKPNLNVVRKKPISSTNIAIPSEIKSAITTMQTPKKPRKGNFIQTQGVFSDGINTDKIKNRGGKERESSASLIVKPKLNLNKKINKAKENEHMNDLLKDDFISDSQLLPALTEVPVMLPQIYLEKTRTVPTLEEAFECFNVKPETKGKIKDETSQAESIQMFQQSSNQSKKFLFEFPHDFFSEAQKSVDKQKTKENPAKSNKLSAEGSGAWGKLRVHADGRAYISSGNFEMEVNLNQHNVKQHIFSTNVDPDNVESKATIKYGGLIDACFTLTINEPIFNYHNDPT